MRFMKVLASSLLFTAVVVMYWAPDQRWALIGSFLSCAAFCLAGIIEQERQSQAAQRQWDAGLVARADEQHRQVMEGDAAGIYGLFPPPVGGMEP